MKLIRRFAKGFHKGQKGFTLIELLVVVAILGILAAIVILNISGLIGTGASEAAATELHNVQTAVIAYQAQHDGALPPASGFPTTPEMDPYFLGGIGNIEGTYTLNADGSVTQNSYPGT